MVVSCAAQVVLPPTYAAWTAAEAVDATFPICWAVVARVQSEKIWLSRDCLVYRAQWIERT